MATVKLFLCGDVMTGRGIDQILPHPGRPQLFEPYVQSALDYVALAERVSGPLSLRVDFDYIWGDALAALAAARPDARIVNLETAVTVADDPWPGKGIHYRMHPANVRTLTAARIDCCALANNHVMDWGAAGLRETLDVLHGAGMRCAGAGADAEGAAAPAVIPLGNGSRVLVFAIGLADSGVPDEWAAGDARPGVCFLAAPSLAAADRIAARVHAHKRAGDIVVLSIHWGSNWGYEIPAGHRAFAHDLIERCGVDLVHGHSSHHPRGMEIHRGKLILYGCGDFLNDYEGIHGYESFRPDLALMYFATLDATSGKLLRLALVPMQIRRFRLNRPNDRDTAWMEQVLARLAGQSGLDIMRENANTFVLRGAQH